MKIVIVGTPPTPPQKECCVLFYLFPRSVRAIERKEKERENVNSLAALNSHVHCK